MTKNTNDQFFEVLNRGIEEIIDKENLTQKLSSGQKLRIKLGIDPTSANLHLGRSIPLLKLKDFEKLGHQIVFIIGDFTGQIGDTSDKESERPMLSEVEIQKNLKTYIDQIAKIIDIEKAEIHYNSHWLGELNYKEIGKQANVFSLSSFISRENIKTRLEAGKRISLRELLYPLMQGYDSVKVKADVEIGGTDQKFNLLAGRDLQRFYDQEPQNIILNPIIEGLDGRKMSSSFGNTVNLLDSPNDMFGKIMSLKDEFIIKYFELLTRIPFEEIESYKKQLVDGENPRNIKMKLAFEIVRMYSSEEEALKAKEYFVNTFTNKLIPEDLPTIKPEKYDLLSTLIEAQLCSSMSEARRVVQDGGIKVDGEVIIDPKFVLTPNVVLQKGKKNFIKIL